MTLREPTILEGPLDLARFFITSLTFMRTMKKVDILVDDVKVLEVSKSVKGKDRVYRKGLRTTSSAGMMTVTNVDATGMSIEAKVTQWLAGGSNFCRKLKSSDRIYTSATRCTHSQLGQARQSLYILPLIFIFQSLDAVTRAYSSTSATAPGRPF